MLSVIKKNIFIRINLIIVAVYHISCEFTRNGMPYVHSCNCNGAIQLFSRKFFASYECFSVRGRNNHMSRHSWLVAFHFSFFIKLQTLMTLLPRLKNQMIDSRDKKRDSTIEGHGNVDFVSSLFSVIVLLIELFGIVFLLSSEIVSKDQIWS